MRPGEEDKAFLEEQIKMFETTGWRDMQEDLSLLIENTTSDLVAGNKEHFDYLKGQLNTLKWFSSYEDNIRNNLEQDIEETEEDAFI